MSLAGDKIRKECIRGIAQVEQFEEKVREVNLDMCSGGIVDIPDKGC